MIGIYQIEVPCTNGLVYYYIGQSRDLDSRRKAHIRVLSRGRHENVKLNAIWKSKINDRLSFTILEVCKLTDLRSREQYHIDSAIEIYGNDLVLNIKKGAWTHTDETIQKIRKAVKEHWNTHGVREKMSAAISESISSPEFRKKMSDAQLVVQNRPEVKAKIAASASLPEVKAKRSSSAKAARMRPDSGYNQPEYKERQREHGRVVFNRSDVRQKAIDGIRKVYNDPVTRTRILTPEVLVRRGAAIHRALANPEVSARHSATNKVAGIKPPPVVRGSRWANNGFGNIRVLPGQSLPDGYQFGIITRR